MIKKDYIKRSLASYRTKNGPMVDLVRLAKILSKIDQVPERINFSKAAEISLLAQHYLRIQKAAKNDPR